jgi:hypothetical protein
VSQSWAKIASSAASKIARQHAIGVLGERAQQVECHAGDRDLATVGRERAVAGAWRAARLDRRRPPAVTRR